MAQRKKSVQKKKKIGKNTTKKKATKSAIKKKKRVQIKQKRNVKKKQQKKVVPKKSLKKGNQKKKQSFFLKQDFLFKIKDWFFIVLNKIKEIGLFIGNKLKNLFFYLKHQLENIIAFVVQKYKALLQKKGNKKKGKKPVAKGKKSISKSVVKEKENYKKHRYGVLISLSIFCLFLGILLMLPYGVAIYESEASKKSLEIPKFMKLKEECCSFSATFSSFRSRFILKHDMEKILSHYEVLHCDGKTYYYNSKEDYTIVNYKFTNGFIFNELTIDYGKGNSCSIDTTFKKLELLEDDYSLLEAKRDGFYVIDQDVVFNASSYDRFLEDVDKNVPSILRIVTATKDGDVLITDLEYMNNGKFKVTYDATRDRNNQDHRSIVAYQYEKIGVYKNKFYAYNGERIKSERPRVEDGYYLFSLAQEK